MTFSRTKNLANSLGDTAFYIRSRAILQRYHIGISPASHLKDSANANAKNDLGAPCHRAIIACKAPRQAKLERNWG